MSFVDNTVDLWRNFLSPDRVWDKLVPYFRGGGNEISLSHSHSMGVMKPLYQNHLDSSNAFDTISACDRQTDRQTDTQRRQNIRDSVTR